MNKYKGGMSPDIFRRHMNFIKENYNSDAADAMLYGSYVKGEDVEVTRASRLLAQSTFTNLSFNNMKIRERKTKKRILCGYASADHVLQHAKRMAGQSVLSWELHTKKELWGCL
jgi:hypothetical protein